MRYRLAVALVLACLHPAAGARAATATAAAEAGEGRQPIPRQTFRGAWKTFLADGRYLLTFPARPTRRGAIGTAVVTAGTLLLIQYDDEVRDDITETYRPRLDDVAAKFEFPGRLTVEAAALGAFYGAARWSGREGARSAAATAFEAYLWTTILTSVTKGAFGRDRPTEGVDANEFFSGDTIFPSGHTSRSFAIAAVLADRYGRPAAWLGYPLAALVGLATVQQDTHWASDILAGAGLGLAIGKGIAARHPRAGAPAGPDATGVRAAWTLAPARGGLTLRVAY